MKSFVRPLVFLLASSSWAWDTTTPVRTAIAAATASALAALADINASLGSLPSEILTSGVVPFFDKDAFNNTRMSVPLTVFSHTFVEGADVLRITTSVTNGGTITYSTNRASAFLNSTTANGDVATLQSKEYIPYQPGKSQKVWLTGVWCPLQAAQANVTKRYGLFDSSNGLFFELSGTTLKIVERSNTSGSPVDTSVTQTNWNLDKLNGTGPSGYALDLRKAQLMLIDFAWLGVGTVRYGFVVDGHLVYCHQTHHANRTSDVYMSRAVLPIRGEIRTTGVASASDQLQVICQSVQEEGGNQVNGTRRSVTTGNTSRSVANATDTPLVAIRLKSARVRCKLIPESVNVAVAAAADMKIDVRLNPTLAGGAWSSIDESSSFERYLGGTSATGGTTMEAFFYSGSNAGGSSVYKLESDIPAVADIAGTADIVALVVRPIVGNNVTTYGAMTFREIVP